MENQKWKILSLFDGLSGAQIALSKLGVECDYYASEIDTYAMKITRKNFPNTHQLGDILQFFINPDDIQNSRLKNLNKLPKDIDLLIGGSPCTDLSIANNNGQGLEGDQSKLFWAYVRILDFYCQTQKKPFYFVLENVESMKTKDFVIITNTLGVEPIFLDYAKLSPQRRRRYFWTNIPSIKQPKIVPSKLYPDNKIGLVIADILEPDAERKQVKVAPERIIKTAYGVRWNNLKKNGQQSQYANSTEVKPATLDANSIWKNGQRIVKSTFHGLQGRQAIETDKKFCPVDATFGKRQTAIVDFNSQQNRAFTTNDKHGTLPATRTSSKTNIVFEDYRIEKLTWTEIERLQGLPDSYSDLGEENRVEPRGRAIGNGFQIDIVAHLLSFMLPRPRPLERAKRILRGEQQSLF